MPDRDALLALARRLEQAETDFWGLGDAAKDLLLGAGHGMQANPGVSLDACRMVHMRLLEGWIADLEIRADGWGSCGLREVPAPRRGITRVTPRTTALAHLAAIRRAYGASPLPPSST
jgi:hypothetical protein